MQKTNQHPTSISCLPGVGKQIAAHLERLGIKNISDLLLHLPVKYQDRTKIKTIRSLLPGEDAVIEGEIVAVSYPKKGKTKLLCTLKDETGFIHLRFFQAYQYQKTILKSGQRLRCFSQVKLGVTGLEMIHPEIQLHPDENKLENFLTAFYPATEGVHQNLLRKLMKHALTWLEKTTHVSELLPHNFLQDFTLPTLKEALRFIHQPACDTELSHLIESKIKAHQRLIFEELLAHRLSLLNTKKMFQAQKSICLIKSSLLEKFIQQLPYSLTRAQQKVIEEIQNDLTQSMPMLRLVQGDVGSGKTVVAAVAMLQAVGNGYQAALMAPTELLAEQHYHVFKKWLLPLGMNVEFLSGNVKANDRMIALQKIKSGQANVIIGTHALFQDKLSFLNLALVVVDEQHRFGVEQRAALIQKATTFEYYPHQLILSATPIPRTLAMSFYADLDCSTIDELPPGRTPIHTIVVPNSRRDEIIKRLEEGCKQGKQIYWVCPLIEESESINCQAATNTAELLTQALSNYRVALIHGRLHAHEKEKIMHDFQQGNVQVLVATTVIEVGVDVPNASIMVIENAERLGLSQLHQLRGRVGRGSQASHCVLLYQQPLSILAEERLRTIRETTDGFKIAQRDLELRGPGEIFGIRQTGALEFRIANLIRDQELLPKVHRAAELIVKQYDSVIEPLVQRWIPDKKELAKV